MTTTTKKITVILSERSPIRLDPERWPLVASADWHNGKVECQANTIRRIKVREHADGRRIVYGFETAGNGGQRVGYRPVHAGFMLDPGEDTVRAIRRVAGVLGDDGLGEECIADLPAEDIE